MIIIADSGSTKTDWCVVENGKLVHQFFTKGTNPFFQTEEEISEAIEAMSVPMPPKLVPMIRSRHWSQKPESRIVVGTLLMTWLEPTATSSGWPPTSERASS